ncbi:hypothetical protein [Streptomyces sp. BH104]|uniref:hypothetical protein n=1 Tax=Streptomyces sp. BH104 TaxID=3410407 RepID=UPI003BB5B353
MIRHTANTINDDQLDALYRRIETLQHVAAGNKRHVQLIVPEWEKTEAEVQRIIALYERWLQAGPPPIGTSVSRWWDARLVELHDAILPPAPVATEPLHRQLIAQLERDRQRMLAAADAAAVDEVRIAQSGIASGYLHAIAHTLRISEGPEAAQQYVQEHADGKHLISHKDTA